jgi:hypothetical protein
MDLSNRFVGLTALLLLRACNVSVMCVLKQKDLLKKTFALVGKASQH